MPRILLFSVFLLMAPQPALGQDTVFSEDFESYSEGTTSPGDGSWSRDISAATLEGEDHFSVQAVSNNNVFEGRDLDAEAVWETKSIDVSAYPKVDFSLLLTQAGTLESNDYVDVSYSTDGGSSFTTITDWNGNGGSGHTLTGEWSNQTVTKSDLSATSFVLRVTMNNDANSEDVRLDYVTVTGKGATTVQFTAASGSVREGAGTTHLTVQLSNPPGAKVTADVAFDGDNSSATSSDIGSYTTQTVTFPSNANDQDTKTVDVSLTSDGAEGRETASFVLENLSSNAIVGSTSRHDLTLRDAVGDHSGDVMITELMPNPDAVGDTDGEYIELYNTTGSAIDVEGWTLDVDGDTDTLPAISIPARGYIVLCKDADAADNGEIQNCDEDYVDGISLVNSGSTVSLLENGTTVDEVTYTGSDPWPDPTGASLIFTGTAENGKGGNWASASQRARGFALDQNGDLGSPGRGGADQNLQPSSEITGSGGWRLLSAPMAGVNAETLAQSNLVQGVSGHYSSFDSNLYRWPGGTTSNVNWTVPTSETTDLTSGARGFLWYVFGSAQTAETDLPPFTLSLPGVPRTQSVSASGLEDGFYLLGNPYAQSYDVSDLDLTGKGFSTTVQIWDPSAGSYVAVTQASDDSDVIAPYQGFFIERTLGTSSETLTFSPDGTRADPSSLKRSSEGPTRLAFRLTGSTSDSVITRDEALTFQAHPKASLDRDVQDATKLTPLTDQYVTAAFAQSEDGETVSHAVASVPSPLPRDSIGLPIRLATRNAESVDQLTLSWPTWKRVPDHWALVLHDTVADSLVNLRQESEYSFELQSPEKYRVREKRTENGFSGPRSPSPLPSTVELKSGAGDSRFIFTVKPSRIPVELTGLRATASSNRAMLHWSTASETNNVGFYVEHRSPHGDEFQRIGFVGGAGTTNQSRDYRYRTDPLDGGRHSFRLRQVDVDGTERYSTTVSANIQIDRAAKVTVMPTVVRSEATVRLHVRREQDVRMSLYDTLGRRVRTVHQGTVSPNRSHMYRVEVDGLSSGLYFVRAIAPHFQQTEKVLVVR